MLVAHLELPKLLVRVVVWTSPTQLRIEHSPVGKNHNHLNAHNRMLEVSHESIPTLCHRSEEQRQENDYPNQSLTPLCEEEVVLGKLLESEEEDREEEDHQRNYELEQSQPKQGEMVSPVHWAI